MDKISFSNKILIAVALIATVAVISAAVVSNVRDQKEQKVQSEKDPSQQLEDITPTVSVNLNTGVTPTTVPTKILMQDVTELKIEDLTIGSGEEVESGDTIVIHYQGLLTNGTEFDSSYKRGKPFETQIGVGRVIKGWDEGVIGMKAGGKRRLTIPPDKAYGTRGAPPSIPPNATLIFTLELLEIK